MTSKFNTLLVALVITAIGSTLSLQTASAGIISTPGLTAIAFWEFSGPAVPKFVSSVGPKITTQLGALNGASNDFVGVPSEWYDVFYSNANGSFNVNGNYVTIQARYDNASGGGGLNIGAVDLVIGSSAVRADVLTSWVGLGTNYIAGSEVLSVDPADVTPVPTTFTTMGNTAGVNGRMRVTVTWSKLVPEPTTCLLMSCGLIGIACGTRRRSK